MDIHQLQQSVFGGSNNKTTELYCNWPSVELLFSKKVLDLTSAGTTLKNKRKAHNTFCKIVVRKRNGVYEQKAHQSRK